MEAVANAAATVVGAVLFAESIGPRLATGWTLGTLVSALGVYLSLKVDLPTGATIVCTFVIILILMAVVRVLGTVKTGDLATVRM